MEKTSSWGIYSSMALALVTLAITLALVQQYITTGTLSPELMIMGASALATVIMVIFVGAQTKATQEMVAQAKKQLEEMRKDREFYLRREHTLKLRKRVVVPLLEEFSEMSIEDDGFRISTSFETWDDIGRYWRPDPTKVDILLFYDLLDNHWPKLKDAIDQFNGLLKSLENNDNIKHREEIVQRLGQQKDVILTELKRLELMELLPGRCEFISGEWKEKR